MNHQNDRQVVVYGADTRVGHQLTRVLAESGQSCVERSTEFFIDSPQDVAVELASLKNCVVVNCTLDPDSGKPPLQGLRPYMPAMLTALSQSRKLGLRFIHVSSCQIFGQKDRLVNRPKYVENDPVYCNQVGGWRPLLASTEFAIYQQTSRISLLNAKNTSSQFRGYVLRLGTTIDDQPYRSQHTDYTSLDHLFENLRSHKETVSVPDSRCLITPITTRTAAEAIAKLCRDACVVPMGTYHVASKDHVPLSRMLDYASMRIGNLIEIRMDSEHSLDYIDTDMAIASELWEKRSLMKMPSWRDVIDQAFADRPLHATTL